MLVENNYPQDTRVRNEATLLAAAGYDVSVICLRKRGQPAMEIVDGVHAFRVPRLELFKKTPDGKIGVVGRIIGKIKSVIGYVSEYSYFTTACFVMSCYVFMRRGFDAIHAHNPPDTLFMVALPFRLIGKKFVFDHHDLCPELYKSRFGTQDCLPTRLLGLAEWCTLKLANITIATNQSYKEIQLTRGRKDPNAIFVVRNGPGAVRMVAVPPSQRLRSMNKCILAYVGCLNPQDGVDYLLRSLSHLKHHLKRVDFHCVIMGSGDSLEDLRSLAKELDISDVVELPGFVSEDDLRANLSAADICMDPDPSSPLNDVSTWIKIMEYMAYAKPIVTFDLKETRVSAQEAALYVPPNDEIRFAQAVATLMDDPAARERMGRYGRKRVENELQWSIVGQNLLTAYEYLFRTKPTRVGNAATLVNS